MRDLLVFGIIFTLLPLCLFRPWIGVLLFSWISYMNPHRFTWSIAYDFPFAKIVAIVTIFGLLLTKDKMSLPRRRETILIILLGLYFTFTSLFAFNSFAVWAQWEKVIKILIMTLVTLILINDREKLKYLVMVIAFSIGFLGIKGGIFSIATSGQYRIYGPEGSFFGDNNDLALALNMILPMLFYLARDEENRYLKMACWFTFVMSIVAVIFTYSRGGFLTLVGVLTILTFKSRYKVLAFSMIFFIAIISTPFIPAKWFDRIESIKAYEQDRSALGRINAWYTAWNIAKDRPFVGGGFETFTREVFSLYAPDPEDVHDVHSIYFEILGEHGIIAFVLFVILITSTVSSTQRLKKITENDVRFKWVENYSNMFQISLIAYMIGGIFLGRAYFDLFYHIVAMVVIMKVLVEKEKELRI